jgi:hypothetical protein
LSTSDRQWEKNRANRESQRDSKELGDIPPCRHPDRRLECEANTALWLKTYLAGLFFLEWSPDHYKAIEKLDQVIGGLALYALGMPRGSGKTQISLGGVLKSVLSGRRRYPVLFGATDTKAKKLMADIREQILAEQNVAMAEDYPEFILPMRQIRCDSRKSKDQTFRGEFTQIACGPRFIDFGVVPTLAGVAGFPRTPFSIIEALSISSTEIRGTHRTKLGEAIRPDMVLLDDVQTDKVSQNPERIEELLATIEGSVLGMAGPTSKITALAACTVRVPGDASDRMLNRQISPAWQGERYKMLYAFPERMDLWKEYRSIFVEHLQQDGTGSRATDFYRERFDEMNRGAVVAWPERFEPGQLSGIQRAMDLFLFKPREFACEYQNSPLEMESSGVNLRPADLAGRTSGRMCGVIPSWANKLTCGVDVQGSLLYWLVAAWKDDFTGAIVDYGTWPDQKGRRNYALGDVLFTLQSELPTAALDGQIRNGLAKLSLLLAGRDWPLDGAAARVKLDRIFMDMGYKDDVVTEFCRTSPHAGLIRACRGRGIKAKATQWGNFVRKDGERLGFHWLEKILSGGQLRTVQHDVNFWKTFLKERFLQAVGEPGALTLYEDGVTDHSMLIQHLTAEFGVLVNADGNTVEEWDCRPGRDNHWWDCLVMATAAASFEGVRLATQQSTPIKKPKVSFADQQRAAMQRQRGR